MSSESSQPEMQMSHAIRSVTSGYSTHAWTLNQEYYSPTPAESTHNLVEQISGKLLDPAEAPPSRDTSLIYRLASRKMSSLLENGSSRITPAVDNG